jgi:hypothetical protein
MRFSGFPQRESGQAAAPPSSVVGLLANGSLEGIALDGDDLGPVVRKRNG